MRKLVMICIIFLDARANYCLAQNKPARAEDAKPSWNPQAAAAYLNSRAEAWRQWSGSARGQGTTCLSCHTSMPIALALPALARQLGETAPGSAEKALLENVKKRVENWALIVADAASTEDPFVPFYGKSRKPSALGAEAVLNALVLVNYDARRAQGALSETTKKSLTHLWQQQKDNGAWHWLEFGLKPWENDAAYYGAAMAAIAVGTAGKNYYDDPGVTSHVASLKSYLKKHFSDQPLHHRLFSFWASALIPGILTEQDKARFIDELSGLQEADGGWSLPRMGGNAIGTGGWKSQGRHPEGTPSDGYATGAVVLSLKRAGLSHEQGMIKKGVAWLRSHERDGTWPAVYLNTTRNPEENVGKFMRDAATAFAVLALCDSP
jgi:squalene-hopene/tetraprenyl-beta-curcumene cyclase